MPADASKLCERLLDAIDDLVYLCDRQGKLTFLNAAFQELTGHDPKEFVGKPLAALFEDAHLELVARCYQRALGGEPNVTEVRFKESGILVECKNVPVRDAEDRVTGVFGFGRDLTERAQARDALRASESRFNSIFHSNFIGIAFTTEAGGILDANDAFLALLDCTREELENGKVRWLEMTPPEYLHLDVKGISEIKEKGYATPFEKEYLRRDGTRVPILIGGAALKAHGTVAVTYAVDITERKRAEAARRRLERQLYDAQRMEALGQLAGGVAHDINNMLTAVTGTISMLQDDFEDDPRNQEDFRAILHACERGHDLTRNLLGFARKGKYTPRTLSLNDLIQDTLALLKRTMPKGILIRTHLQQHLHKIRGDAGQISHALVNVYLNAIHAMGERGTLTVASVNGPVVEALNSERGPGRYVQSIIHDTGHGMNEETRQHAFEPFFTDRPDGSGTGLGLAMVYGTISNHGGDVQIQSAVGQGCTVTITLPAAPAPAEPSEEAKPTTEPASGTVLLVDDEPSVLRIGKRILERIGYRALTAESGIAALEIYRDTQDEIALVILDMAMPQMNGPETFRELKRIDRQVQVLISSGYFLDDRIEELLAEGAIGFAQKPYTIDSLKAEIARARAQAEPYRWPEAVRPEDS